MPTPERRDFSTVATRKTPLARASGLRFLADGTTRQLGDITCPVSFSLRELSRGTTWLEEHEQKEFFNYASQSTVSTYAIMFIRNHKILLFAYCLDAANPYK